jgi:hypothetical protein
MANDLREAAQWRKGKTPVIRKYLEEHNKMLTEIAGKGFLAMPGYAYNAETFLELATKENLSELNYKIIAETVERELKQSGINYDLEYKAATIAWEQAKQALLSAWEVEYAILKQNMAYDEELLNRAAIEIDARSVVLLQAKTAIEIEMEGYRGQIAALDRNTAPLEVQLAEAKLATAQRKLDVIPIIYEILAKEQQLVTLEAQKVGEATSLNLIERQIAEKESEITAILAEIVAKQAEVLALENTKAGYVTTLMGAEAEIAAKQLDIIPIIYEIIAKQEQLIIEEGYKADEYTTLIQHEIINANKRAELVPWFEVLATKIGEYATLVMGNVPLYGQIANEKVAQANQRVLQSGSKVTEIGVQVTNEGLKGNLAAQRQNLEIAKANYSLNLATSEVALESQYQTALLSINSQLLNILSSANASILSSKLAEANSRMGAQMATARSNSTAQNNFAIAEYGAQAYYEIRKAEIAKLAEISAKLTHLIG